MRIAFAIAVAVISTNCFASDPFCDTGSPHRIDVQLERDLDRSGGVTSEMRNASGRAYSAWDAELNKTYRELMSSLSTEEKDALRKAQRAWLAFRDAESDFWNTEYASGGGTMALVIVDGRSVDFIRSRVCELQRYKALDF